MLILDYQVYNNCEDQAYGPDCLRKFQEGLCNANLSSNQNVQTYCKKTCGLCSTSNTQLNCQGLVRNCNGGSCSAASYFQTSTIRCNCPSNLAGSYCQRRNTLNPI